MREVFPKRPPSSLTNWVSWSSDGRHLFAMKAIDGRRPPVERRFWSLATAVRRERFDSEELWSALWPCIPMASAWHSRPRNRGDEVWVLENFLPA